jgi:hypothetical protein
MQGMMFLLMSEQGPVNQGVVTSQITPEKYLCTFVRPPQVSRICDIEEMQQWNFFPNQDSMNDFVRQMQQQAAGDPKPDPKKPDPKKPDPKKPAAKKSVKK